MSKAHRSIQFPNSPSSSEEVDIRRAGASPREKPLWLSQSPNSYHNRRSNHNLDGSPRGSGGKPVVCNRTIKAVLWPYDHFKFKIR